MGIYNIFLLIFICIFCTKNWWTYDYNRYRKTIESWYMPLYVTLDSNSHEKVWTWKSVAIISKWIRMWWQLIGTTLIEVLRVWVSFLVTAYFLYQMQKTSIFTVTYCFVPKPLQICEWMYWDYLFDRYSLLIHE